jgi:hypothetical protein
MNNWTAAASKIFECGSMNAVTGAYTERFRVDGIGNVYTASVTCSGSGGSAFIANAHSIPGADNVYDSGWSGGRWRTIYAANGTINTSDERDKTDVVDTDLGLDFINALRPINYRWSERGEDGYQGIRTHMGFVAQEVAATLGELADGRAVWVHLPEETRQVAAAVEAIDYVAAVEAIEAVEYAAATYDDDGNEITPEVQAVEGVEGVAGVDAVEAVEAVEITSIERQGLRPEEMVAPLVKAVQELTTRLEAVEAA